MVIRAALHLHRLHEWSAGPRSPWWSLQGKAQGFKKILHVWSDQIHQYHHWQRLASIYWFWSFERELLKLRKWVSAPSNIPITEISWFICLQEKAFATLVETQWPTQPSSQECSQLRVPTSHTLFLPNFEHGQESYLMKWQHFSLYSSRSPWQNRLSSIIMYVAAMTEVKGPALHLFSPLLVWSCQNAGYPALSSVPKQEQGESIGYDCLSWWQPAGAGVTQPWLLLHYRHSGLRERAAGWKASRQDEWLNGRCTSCWNDSLSK